MGRLLVRVLKKKGNKPGVPEAVPKRRAVVRLALLAHLFKEELCRVDLYGRAWEPIDDDAARVVALEERLEQ